MPGPADFTPKTTEVPEDVRAELDAEERRVRAEPGLGAPVEAVPEDVLAERDLEARLGSEEVRVQLTEGTPPADKDEDASA
jgi:hypothetical protein